MLHTEHLAVKVDKVLQLVVISKGLQVVQNLQQQQQCRKKQTTFCTHVPRHVNKQWSTVHLAAIAASTYAMAVLPVLFCNNRDL
jgi:hypothetical protein